MTLSKIIDLHCDLLGCVAEDMENLNFSSPELRCSVPQLIAGNVGLQVLAIWSVTNQSSVETARRQVELYKELLKKHPDQVGRFRDFSIESKKVHCIFSIENASGLLDENESLETAFTRLDEIEKVEKILYVSLTWNHENRFGGGNESTVGLKRDGELFLEYIDGKNIAIDLSHTSDSLGCDILNHIDKKGLNIPVMASHSNFRSVREGVARNLPDDLAKEIINRRGIIGINLIRYFIGDTFEDFIKHFQYGIDLGGRDSLCIGADFFGGAVDNLSSLPDYLLPYFQARFDNASCYQEFLLRLKREFGEEQVLKIANKNAQEFLTRMHLFEV